MSPNQRIPLGEILRIKRQSKKLSARATSVAAGLSESYVGKIEKGEIDVSLRAFSQIAKVLEFTDLEIACVVRWESMR